MDRWWRVARAEHTEQIRPTGRMGLRNRVRGRWSVASRWCAGNDRAPRCSCAAACAGLHQVVGGLLPGAVEGARIAAGLPIMVGQPGGITEGVYFVFALPEPWFHIREIAVPGAAGGALLKAFAYGIEQGVLRLPVDDPRDQLAERGVAADVGNKARLAPRSRAATWR